MLDRKVPINYDLHKVQSLEVSLVQMGAQGRIQDFKRGGGWQTIFIEGW